MEIPGVYLVFLNLFTVGYVNGALPLPGCNRVTADLVFLIDSSGSVGQINFQSQLVFMEQFAGAFTIGRTAMQIGVVTFSTNPYLEFNMNAHLDKASLTAAIKAIPSGGTFTAQALDFVKRKGFLATAGDRADTANIVIILTDGKSINPNGTAINAKVLRDSGVEIYAVGIGAGIDTDELKTVASPGSTHLVQVNSFGALSSIQETIRNALCEKINECAVHPCGNGGTCIDGLGTFTCNCKPGYTGHRCQTNIDECANNPCQHGGRCQDGVAAYTCHCARGFTGNNCETDIDECANNPCQHGGRCQDGVAAYTCHCARGFTGNNCETDIDECNTNPCQHGGSCTEGVGSYTCQCIQGYTGHDCQTNIDECSSSPCQHGGRCQDDVGSYTCQCTSHYTGSNCETEANHCDNNPCQNGGQCTNNDSGFNCTCPKNFFGKNCEINFCIDMIPNCASLFGVCKDIIRAATLCRGSCGICGDSQILFVEKPTNTPPKITSSTPCLDTEDCRHTFGACTNRTLAETACRQTCGACGDTHIVFG